MVSPSLRCIRGFLILQTLLCKAKIAQKLLVLWCFAQRQLWTLEKMRPRIALSPLSSPALKDAYKLLFLMLYLTRAQALTPPGLYRSLRDRGHVPVCEIKLTSKDDNYI